MEPKEIIEETVNLIHRHLPRDEYRVLLFGSWAKDTAEATSDIDIGIQGPKAVDGLLMLRLQEEIKGIPTLRRIDVVDLHEADEEFRKEILSYAKAL